MRVSSVNVGAVATRENARGKQGRTGIGKRPVAGAVQVVRSGLAGDGSAYRSRALGDTAVHAFCRETYDAVAQLRGRPLPMPCFGENLTIEGYSEREARVGDVLRIGSVTLHVNQPVVRCSWPGVVAGEPKLLKWLRNLHGGGFYLDVREPGVLAAGQEISLLERGEDPALTIAQLNQLLGGPVRDPGLIDAVLASRCLAERWKASLRKALAR
jgi:MOSC domain-containing protein YiiM